MIPKKFAKISNAVKPSLGSAQHRSLSVKSILIYDREKIEEDMANLLLQISQKQKEYDDLHRNFLKVEEQNRKTVELISFLIKECQQINDPIERRTKATKTDRSHKVLIKNLQSKFDSFVKELNDKENHLNNMKVTNKKTVRLFEIEDKLKEANGNLNQITKEFNECVNKVNSIKNYTGKTNYQIKALLSTNNKLKHDKDDMNSKIKLLELENHDLEEKASNLEAKNNDIKAKITQLINDINNKDEEIKQLKDKEKQYTQVLQDKKKDELDLDKQIRQINNLKERIDKKNRQIKDLLKNIENLNQENKALEQQEKNYKLTSSKINELITEKKNKENELKDYIQRNENLLMGKHVSCKIKTDHRIEKQIYLNLNVPFTF